MTETPPFPGTELLWLIAAHLTAPLCGAQPLPSLLTLAWPATTARGELLPSITSSAKHWDTCQTPTFVSY